MKNEVNKSFNLDELIRITNGDEKFISEMIDVFIKTTEEGMTEIENAIRENNYKAVSVIAHKIAPPCRHMGAELLLNYIKTMESCATGLGKIDDLTNSLTQARNEMYRVISDLKIENDRLSK